MNTQLWKGIINFVALDKYPKLPCPYCNQVELTIDQQSVQTRKISQNYERSATSRHYQAVIQKKESELEKSEQQLNKVIEHSALMGILLGIGQIALEAYRPEYHFHKFIAFMSCKSCGDSVSINGLAQVDLSDNSNKPPSPTLFKVEHFSTTIPFFEIDKQVPLKVQLELLGAFHYFHIDTNSSASKLRRAIEHFCKELGAETDNLNNNIQALAKSYPLESELLHTLRLVGNEGTHADGVNEDDLLTAFEIFKEVLSVFRKREILAELKNSQKVLNDKFKKEKKKEMKQITP